MQRMMITICVFIRKPLKKGEFQTNFIFSRNLYNGNSRGEPVDCKEITN